MAILDDLNYTSISDMDTDEAVELLRQIRLSRRIPDKKPKAVVKRTETKKKTLDVDPAIAAELLKILGGTSND